MAISGLRQLVVRISASWSPLSTRARITATTFTNEYEWGDFKGSPGQMMQRYDDAHLYCLGHHHGKVQRVVVLGRGGAGKSTLARQLGEVTGLPVAELDTQFWQAGLNAADPSEWTECQRELVRGEAWILAGDLGPYDGALDVRLRAADTIIVLNFAFLRCAWRSVLRGRDRADYWRGVWTYRRHSLPRIMRKIRQDAPHARLYVLRHPGMVRCLLAEIQPGGRQPRACGPHPRWARR